MTTQAREKEGVWDARLVLKRNSDEQMEAKLALQRTSAHLKKRANKQKEARLDARRIRYNLVGM